MGTLTLLANDKNLSFVSKQNMRPRHWSNVTNHKNDHWKTVKLTITSFQKLRLQTVLIFFKFANPYLFWICCDLWVVIFLLHSIWWRFPPVYSKYWEISSWNSSFDLFCYTGCSFRSFLSLLFSLRANSPIWASEASLAWTSLFSQWYFPSSGRSTNEHL